MKLREEKTNIDPKKNEATKKSYKTLSDVPVGLKFRLRSGGIYFKDKAGTLFRVDKDISKARRKRIFGMVKNTGCTLIEAVNFHSRGYRPNHA